MWGASDLREWIDEFHVTIANPANCEHAREVLRRLRPGRARRLHWKDSDQRSRRRISTAVAELNLMHSVVIGVPLDQQRQERARRLCMQRLLHELSAHDVSHVWVESRTQSLNRCSGCRMSSLGLRDSIVGATTPSHI
ncbi:MAG: hypothetical protein ACTII7_13320 [Galactobacter sp.]